MCLWMTMMVKISLKEQIELAQQRIQETKRTMPFLFKEYSEMKQAEGKLKKAQRKLDEAKRRWEAL